MQYRSELRAIVRALTKRKQFIGNRSVTIETAHATLSRVLKQRQVTPRQDYFPDKLAASGLDVVYKRGKQNAVADAVSRRPAFVVVITRSQLAGGAAQPRFSRADWENFYVDAWT